MSIPVKDWMREYDDPASKYALRILDGELAACEHMRNTAARHFDDLERGLYIWNPKMAERPYEFLSKICMVLDNDTYEERPIQLMDWQLFMTFSIHSWLVSENDPLGRTPGTRRYSKIFLSTSKAAGKSAYWAGHQLYMLTRDGYWDIRAKRWVNIRKQTCVISASTLEQVQEVALRPAIAMVEANPLLTDPRQAHCVIEGGQKMPKAIFCNLTGGRLMALSGRKGGTGIGGRILHSLHSEEASETIDATRWRALEAGFKNAQQPLMSIATNPSHIASGIAYREYTDARHAARGEGSDTLLSLIYSSDDSDVPESVIGKEDWYPPEESWVKSNPGLPYGVPRPDYIRRQIEIATTPRERRETLRLNFGTWKGFGNGLLSVDLVNRASLDRTAPRLEFDDMVDRELYLGLDLSRKNDLSALAYLWVGDGRAWLKVHSYFPEQNLRGATAESSADLEAFAEAGWIRKLPGSTNTYAEIADDIVRAAGKFDLRGVAVDVWGVDDLFALLDQRGVTYSVEGRLDEDCTWDGIHFVIHPQGWTHSKKTNLSQETSISALERWFHSGNPEKPPSITVERNPVFIHAVDSSIVKESEKLTRKITKRDALNTNRGRIDALIAAIMACGLADRGVEAEDRSVSVGMFGSPDFDPKKLGSSTGGKNQWVM